MTASRSVGWFSRTQHGWWAATNHSFVTARLFAWLVLPLAVWAWPAGTLRAADAPKAPIEAVSISKPFFNPTLDEKVQISFVVNSGGELSVLVLDRDGFAVRSLVSRQPVKAGRLSYSWDGRDDQGRVVPDEAYSLKVDLSASDGVHSYFPANSFSAEIKPEIGYYDRQTAVFSYRLPVAARVHVQAGLNHRDEKSGEVQGPVLKTLANREPRPAGAVIETWNGLDETGSYYIPDLVDFAMAVAATSLPENAMITVGQKKQSFIDRALTRRGASLLTHSSVNHQHHGGLSALDDVSPTLHVRASNASPVPTGNLWKVDGSTLKGKLVLEGSSADSFAKQPGALMIFLDANRIETKRAPTSGMLFEVPLTELTPGPHIVAFDWASEYGPVAVTSLRVQVSGPGGAIAGSGRR
jgi:hypothetical protein